MAYDKEETMKMLTSRGIERRSSCRLKGDGQYRESLQVDDWDYSLSFLVSRQIANTVLEITNPYSKALGSSLNG